MVTTEITINSYTVTTQLMLMNHQIIEDCMTYSEDKGTGPNKLFNRGCFLYLFNI